MATSREARSPPAHVAQNAPCKVKPSISKHKRDGQWTYGSGKYEGTENKWGEKRTFAQSLDKERWENWCKNNPQGLKEKRKTDNSRARGDLEGHPGRRDQYNKYNIQQRGR